jgi:hypothetical protein
MQALYGVEQALRNTLSSYRIHSEAKGSGKSAKLLVNKLRAMESASQPLINLVESGPLLEELTPQRFLVALESKPLAKLVAGDQANDLELVDNQNPHRVVNMRTLHEFAIEHWSEYEAAKAAYATKSWYYHALPDSLNVSGA